MPCPCHRNFPSGCIDVGRDYFAPADLDPLKGIWRCFRIPPAISTAAHAQTGDAELRRPVTDVRRLPLAILPQLGEEFGRPPFEPPS